MPRTPKEPKAPLVSTPISVPTIPPVASSKPTGTPTAALTTLPPALNVSIPDIPGMMPDDWFKPSSSKVPQITDAEKAVEAKIAHEQGNSIELLSLNMDNAIGLAQVAVKATKIGKLVAEYQIGLEEIRAVGVKLRGAQMATANEEKNVALIAEKSNQLTAKLGISQTETNYLNQLKPIKESEWANKLQVAQIKAQEALQQASHSAKAQ